LWVAEGFIKRRGESTMEEVAEGYLQELVHRNLLQINERNSSGRIKSFRMHDFVRELAVDLCHRECFGVVYEEDKYTESLDESDARRLVIHKLKKDIYQSVSGVHRLRSIIALDIGIPSSTLLPLVVEKSRYMSVLELSGLPIEKVPDAIGDLFNLRYLGLRGSKVKLLPKSIEKLSNLLTLDLSGSYVKELPRGIGKLKKLRQIFSDKPSDRFRRDFQCGTGVCIPKGLENLTNLQTLLSLEVQDDSVRQLGELRQLRSLEIWNVKGTYCGCVCASLAEMQYLSYLHVNASDNNEVLRLNGLPPNLKRLSLTGRLAEGMLEESPLFQTAGQNLYSLSISWSQMTEDPLPLFSPLRNLTDLMLTRVYNGKQMIFLAGWFPELKNLRLRDLPNLEVLEVKKGAMLKLEILTLVNLESMVEVPPGIEFLAHVKNLSFREITNEFLTLLRQCPRTQGMQWRHTLRRH
jgi:disease resistance protein RPM1